MKIDLLPVDTQQAGPSSAVMAQCPDLSDTTSGFIFRLMQSQAQYQIEKVNMKGIYYLCKGSILRWWGRLTQNEELRMRGHAEASLGRFFSQSARALKLAREFEENY